MNSKEAGNPLETEKISKLLAKFCIPSLASSLVTCLYNIVDQLFIGNLLGIAGNAATNVVFPMVTLVTALSLMCGVGPANAMNLYRGKGDTENARKCVGGGFGIMVLCGLLCMVLMLVRTRSLLTVFGCTETVMPYALEYARIIAVSFVFSIVSASGTFIIRADGSPRFSLALVVTGSVLNIILDYVFIFVFGWSIAGAAWATLIAQVISTAMVIWYMIRRFSAFRLLPEDFRPDLKLYGQMAAIGFGPAFNFGTQAIVQVLINNALRRYGTVSIYGADVCLAVAGVANKVNTLANAVIIGMTNGLQPIASYNYGRKNYARVAEAAKQVVITVLLLGSGIFLLYQLLPVQITALFGDGNDAYFEFAARFFRVFYLLIIFYGLQSSVAGFFSSLGKVKYSISISLVRQVIFFPLALMLLPRIMGLDGVLWAGPVADLAMAVTAAVLFVRELKKLQTLTWMLEAEDIS